MISITANLERNAGPNKTLVFGQTLDWLITEETKPESNAYREFLNLEFCCNHGIKNPGVGKIVELPEDSFQEQATSRFGCENEYKAYMYLGECINCLFCHSRNSKTVVFIAVWPPGDGPPDGGDNIVLSEEFLLGLVDETNTRTLSPGHSSRVRPDIIIVIMESLFRSANAILSYRERRFHEAEKEDERAPVTTLRVNHMRWSEIEWEDLVPRLQLYATRRLKRICNGRVLHGQSADYFVFRAISKVIKGKRKPREDDVSSPLKFLARVIDSDISHLWQKHESQTLASVVEDTFEINVGSELNDYIRKNDNAEITTLTKRVVIHLIKESLSRWNFNNSGSEKEDVECKWSSLPNVESNPGGKSSSRLIWILRYDEHQTGGMKIADPTSKNFSPFLSENKESVRGMTVQTTLPTISWTNFSFLDLDAGNASLATDTNLEAWEAESPSDGMGEKCHQANSNDGVNCNEIGMTKSLDDLVNAYICSISGDEGSVENIFYDTFAEEWRSYSQLGWIDDSGLDHVDLNHDGDREPEGAAMLTEHQQFISDLGHDLFGTTRNVLDLREGPSNDQLNG